MIPTKSMTCTGKEMDLSQILDSLACALESGSLLSQGCH